MRTLATLILLGSLARCADAQAKPLNKEEIADAVRKCKTKLLSKPKMRLPENWLGKDEKYAHAPVVSFLITEDGTVHNVRLKQRTGVRKLDEYIVRYVQEWKYKPMPGCEGAETTTSMLIHFGRGDEN